MEVAVSPNGTTWTTVEIVQWTGASPTNQWLSHSFRVSDYITPSSTVQVRFRVADTGTGHIVEAGVDLYAVDALVCEFCQQNVGLAGPGTGTLAICGGDLSLGTWGSLDVQGLPPSAPFLLIASFLNLGQPFEGGLLIDTAPATVLALPADPSGNFYYATFVPGGLGSWIPPLYAQVVYVDGAQVLGYGITNAVSIQFQD
jgi:hypothetical protein